MIDKVENSRYVVRFSMPEYTSLLPTLVHLYALVHIHAKVWLSV